MLKSVNGQSALGKLLKSTKIAQLQNKIGDRTLNANGAFPTHQVIEAPASSFSRRDFGLKMRIPKKIKTRRIIVNDLDNKYGLPNFETLNGDYLKKERFQELGIAVEPVSSRFNNSNTSNNAAKSSNTTSNPLFESSKEFLVPQTIAGLLHIKNQPLNSENFNKVVKPELKSLRRPFLKWLATNYPESLTKKSLYEEFKKFIQIEKPQLLNTSRTFIPPTYANSLSGTAGLSYNLKGRLIQTPNGSQTSRLVPGRIVAKSSNFTKCAVGGFVANVSNVAANNSYVEKLVFQNRTVDNENFARELKVPTTVTSAKLYLDTKTLDLTATPLKKTYKSSSIFSRKSKSDGDFIFDDLYTLLELNNKNATQSSSNDQ